MVWKTSNKGNKKVQQGLKCAGWLEEETQKTIYMEQERPTSTSFLCTARLQVDLFPVIRQIFDMVKTSNFSFQFYFHISKSGYELQSNDEINK